MNSTYTFFHDENIDEDDEVVNKDIPDQEKLNSTYDKELPCGHTYR